MTIPPGEAYITRIANRQRRLQVNGEAVNRLVALVLSGEGVTAGEVSLLLVNNSIIRTFNRELLGRERATDVISLPQGPGFSGGTPLPLLGDVIISTEQVIRQAGDFGQTPEEEFKLCLIHGVLHLLGYEDHPEGKRRKMSHREQHYLRQAQKGGIKCREG